MNWWFSIINVQQPSSSYLATFFAFELQFSLIHCLGKEWTTFNCILDFLENDRCLRFNFEEKNAFFFGILLSEAFISLIGLLSKYKTFAKPLLKSGRKFLAKTHIYFWKLYAKLSKLFGAPFGYIGTRKSKIS